MTTHTDDTFAPLPGSPLECLVAANEHGLYCVPAASRHRPAARRILAGEVWEPDTIGWIIAHRRAGDIVHAGTYFGDFLPALARSLAGDGRVWAFEPNPENHACAHVTIALNGLAGVVLHHAALGAAAGRVALVTHDEQGIPLGGASHVDAARDAGADGVAVVRLDDVIPADRPVDVIQLDVEGAEEQALCGALGLIGRWRPALLLERPPEAWLERVLAPLGYAPAGKVHANTAWLPR